MIGLISKTIAASFFAAMLAATAAFADDSGSIRIDKAWARATPGMAKTAAVYLSITNTGTTADQLVSVSTPAAERAEPHTMKMENNVMEMRPLGPVTIAPGKSIVFAPNGNHIMLIGLKAPLKEGDTVPLTLTFAHAGKREATASVEKLGAMHPGDGAKPSGAAMPGMSGMPATR
jgi:copper(I)-binding protein